MSNTYKRAKEFETVNDGVLYIIKKLLKQTKDLDPYADVHITLTVDVNEDEY